MTDHANDNAMTPPMTPIEVGLMTAGIINQIIADEARAKTLAGAAHLLKDILEPRIGVRLDGYCGYEINGRRAEAVQMTVDLGGRPFRLVLVPGVTMHAITARSVRRHLEKAGKIEPKPKRRFPSWFHPTKGVRTQGLRKRRGSAKTRSRT